MAEHSLEANLTKIREAGFGGVEMGAPADQTARDNLKSLLEELSLDFIGQQWSRGDSTEDHIESFKTQFDNNAELSPIHINSHTGKDWYDLDQNVEIYAAANQYAESSGVKLVHEIHRGRATFSTGSLLALLERLPETRICADFSHWCCVHESFLDDQADRIEQAIQHTDYFHARVGHTQSAQINDPRVPEWREALEKHLAWWDRIVAVNRERGAQTLYCCPEFGPYPYMTELPFSRTPLADLWEINLWMFKLLKERYQA